MAKVNLRNYGVSMPFVAGIEEAGRGPVIGPMVMAITVIESSKEHTLREIGVKDSKQLTPKQRKALFMQLQGFLQAYDYKIIEPKEIDNSLISGNSNLNWLEADISIELVKKITKDIQIDQYYIDCPSTNIESYVAYLTKHIPLEPSCIIAEHKADQNYPIVSAASIIAKVIRDQEIENLQTQLGFDFGSGYTSDKKTITFLRDWVKKHKKLPNFVRKSWVTAKNILNDVKQKKLVDY